MAPASVVSLRLAQRYHKLGMLVTWGVPALGIPTLRLTQDPPETRWKLFTRDFSTYSIGAGLFFAVAGLTSRVLQKSGISTPARNFYTICAGVGANLLFGGLGAPRIYQVLEKYFVKNPPTRPPSPQRPMRPPTQAIPARPSPPVNRSTVFSPVVQPFTGRNTGGKPYGFESFG